MVIDSGGWQIRFANRPLAVTIRGIAPGSRQAYGFDVPLREAISQDWLLLLQRVIEKREVVVEQRPASTEMQGRVIQIGVLVRLPALVDPRPYVILDVPVLSMKFRFDGARRLPPLSFPLSRDKPCLASFTLNPVVCASDLTTSGTINLSRDLR